MTGITLNIGDVIGADRIPRGKWKIALAGIGNVLRCELRNAVGEFRPSGQAMRHQRSMQVALAHARPHRWKMREVSLIEKDRRRVSTAPVQLVL
jgi:hypothetical protein